MMKRTVKMLEKIAMVNLEEPEDKELRNYVL